MTALTGGRFELGIGPGLPRAVTTRTEELGMPARTPGEQLADVGETIDRPGELDDAMHTPPSSSPPVAREPVRWRLRNVRRAN